MFARKKYIMTQSVPRLLVAWGILIGGSLLGGMAVGSASQHYGFSDNWLGIAVLTILVILFHHLAYEKAPDTEKEIDGRNGSE